MGSDGISRATAPLIDMDEPSPPELVHAVTEVSRYMSRRISFLMASPMSGVLDKSYYDTQTDRLAWLLWSLRRHIPSETDAHAKFVEMCS